MQEAIQTKTVQGRRELQFSTVDEALADAERLATGPYTQLGNWSLGEIADHLANSLDSATDDNQYKPGLLMRLAGPWIKKHLVSQTPTPGFRMPTGMKPIFMPRDDASVAEGIDHLRLAVERFKAAELPRRSPTFGTMSHKDWHDLHRHHAELHLSFLIPDQA